MKIPWDWSEPSPERHKKYKNALINKLEAKARVLSKMVDSSKLTPKEKDSLRNKLKDLI